MKPPHTACDTVRMVPLRIPPGAVLLAMVGLASYGAFPRPGQTGSLTNAPPAAEQAAILARMRDYAEGYALSLPNFVCTQITSHYESAVKHEHWHKGDTVEAELTYSDGQEHQQLQLVNNKQVHFKVSPARWALTTEGEFGASLRQLFVPESDTHFEWQRWESLAGHRLAVFTFRIDKENSTKQLSVFGVRTILGYRGSVWGEAETGRVWRIADTADDIPEEFQTESIGLTIDYDQTSVAGETYLLPRSATVLDKRPKLLVKNEILYTNYRKFRASSSISFGDVAPATINH